MKRSLSAVLLLVLAGCASVCDENGLNQKVKEETVVNVRDYEKLVEPCLFDKNLKCNKDGTLANGMYKKENIYLAYVNGNLLVADSYSGDGRILSGVFKNSDVLYASDGNVAYIGCTYTNVGSANEKHLIFKLYKEDFANLLKQGKGNVLTCDNIVQKITEIYKAEGIDLNGKDAYDKVKNSKISDEELKTKVLEML